MLITLPGEPLLNRFKYLAAEVLLVGRDSELLEWLAHQHSLEYLNVLHACPVLTCLKENPLKLLDELWLIFHYQ